MTFPLGKKPPAEDRRDITWSALAAGLKLPTPPARFGRGYAFPDWQMLGNGPDESVAPDFDGCGDCVFADAGHVTMLTNRLAGHPVRITGKEVVTDYSAVTGYVLSDEWTDQGTVVRDALKFRRSIGTLDADGRRHKIGAYVSVRPRDWAELRYVAFWFTAATIGFEVPITVWDQFEAGEPWSVVDPQAEIVGGHDVPVVGSPSLHEVGVITWGRRQGMTRDFYETYNDETWAVVFPEELRDGRTRRGLDLATLTAALEALPR